MPDEYIYWRATMSHLMRMISCTSFVVFAIALTIGNIQRAYAGGIALPNVSSLGKSIVAATPLGETISVVTQQVYPERVLVDVYEGKLEGMTFFYSTEIEMCVLADALSKSCKEATTYPDLASHGICVWRDEKKRCAISLAMSDDEAFGPRICLIWLDRKRPWEEEVLEATKELIKREEGRGGNPQER